MNWNWRPVDMNMELKQKWRFRCWPKNFRIYFFLIFKIARPVSNISDEDAVFFDVGGTKSFSARKDQIYFPFVSSKNRVRMRYTRSYGVPKLVVLVLFLDTQVSYLWIIKCFRHNFTIHKTLNSNQLDECNFRNISIDSFTFCIPSFPIINTAFPRCITTIWPMTMGPSRIDGTMKSYGSKG